MLVVISVDSRYSADRKLIGRTISLNRNEHDVLHQQLLASPGIDYTLDSFELVVDKINESFRCTQNQNSKVVDAIDVFAGHYQLVLESGGQMVVRFISDSVFEA